MTRTSALRSSRQRGDESNVVKIDSASGMQTAIGKDASLDEFVEQVGGTPPDKWGGRKPKDLVITPEKAIERWVNGFYPDALFAQMAIEMEGSTENFDIENFIFRWRGPVDEKGKCKELKYATVKKVLADMERKGGIDIEHGPIQLTIKF